MKPQFPRYFQAAEKARRNSSVLTGAKPPSRAGVSRNISCAARPEESQRMGAMLQFMLKELTAELTEPAPAPWIGAEAANRAKS